MTDAPATPDVKTAREVLPLRWMVTYRDADGENGWDVYATQDQAREFADAVFGTDVQIIPLYAVAGYTITPTVRDDAAPDWDDLRGSAPDATGDLPSEEFIRKQRDDWPDPQDAKTGRDDTARVEADRDAFERWYAEYHEVFAEWLERDRSGDTYTTTYSGHGPAHGWACYQAALAHARRVHVAELSAAERRGIKLAATECAEQEDMDRKSMRLRPLDNFERGKLNASIRAVKIIRSLLDDPRYTQPQEIIDGE